MSECRYKSVNQRSLTLLFRTSPRFFFLVVVFGDVFRGTNFIFLTNRIRCTLSFSMKYSLKISIEGLIHVDTHITYYFTNLTTSIADCSITPHSHFALCTVKSGLVSATINGANPHFINCFGMCKMSNFGETMISEVFRRLI